MNFINRIQLWWLAVTFKLNMTASNRSLNLFRGIVNDLRNENKKHQSARRSTLNKINEADIYVSSLHDHIRNIGEVSFQNEAIADKIEETFFIKSKD